MKTPFLILAAGMIFSAYLSLSVSSATAAGEVMIIQGDNGGSMKSRIREIDWIKSTGLPVQIQGRYCMSACTLYLGLPDVCIDRNTIFGFHGPSNPDGSRMRPESFEKYTVQMSKFYKSSLANWYLSTARYELNNSHKRLRGAELIRQGYRECVK